MMKCCTLGVLTRNERHNAAGLFVFAGSTVFADNYGLLVSCFREVWFPRPGTHYSIVCVAVAPIACSGHPSANRIIRCGARRAVPQTSTPPLETQGATRRALAQSTRDGRRPSKETITAPKIRMGVLPSAAFLISAALGGGGIHCHPALLVRCVGSQGTDGRTDGCRRVVRHCGVGLGGRRGRPLFRAHAAAIRGHLPRRRA